MIKTKQFWEISRKILPEFLFNLMRAVVTAFRTPILFSLRSGNFLSSFLNRAVDRTGRPIPWYTYSAVDFLSSKNLSDKSVLEWGCGQSTFWWAEKVKSVISFESSKVWHDRIASSVPSNVTVYLTTDDIVDVDKQLIDSKFDIIVVDGLDRLKCSAKSIEFLAENGVIILDNTLGYRDAEGNSPILELFRKHGFKRIDFYGYSPLITSVECTSFLFYQNSFLFDGVEDPKLSYDY